MPYRILTLLTCVVLLVMPSPIDAEDDTLFVVAWLENNDMMLWRTGDAAPTPYAAPDAMTGIPQQLLISSDGQYTAVKVASPASLWLAAPADADLIELVPNAALPTTDDPKYIRIGNLERAENSTFYFNTYNQLSPYMLPNNDLWSVDGASRTIKLLLPPPQAGAFKLSPDRQHIAISQSGTYNESDGKISLVDNNGQNQQDLLGFPAVSTASDYNFYPPLFWEADNSAFNVALPDKDLVYHDDTALTALWRVGFDGTKTQRGTVQATFFGLPQWSDNGAHLIYLRHQGDISTNQFELMTAAGDGTQSSVYASGTAGNIGVPEWLPNSDQFIYAQGEPGDYWLGQPDQPPQAFPRKIYSPRFIDSSTYVFATAPGDRFELRYARLGETSSTLIATIHNAIPIFDATLVP